MKIHFCDLCNESVPQADLDQGRAVTRKGRVICSTCERAMSHAGVPADVSPAHAGEGAHAPSGGFTATAAAANLQERTTLVSAPSAASVPAPFAAVVNTPVPPGPAPIARGHSLALWVAALALLCTAAAVYVLDQRLSTGEEQARLNVGLLRRQGERVAELEHLPAKIALADSELERRLDVKLDALSTRLEQLNGQYETSSEKAAIFQKDLGHAIADVREELRGRQGDGEKRIEELSHRVAHAEDVHKGLSERIDAVEKSAVAAAVKAAADSAEKAAAAGPAAAGPAAWTNLLGDLTSSNPGSRWQAVVSMGDSKDPAVVPHLVPMLKDSDVFVRMAAARVLGDLNTPTAVPGLIDALEDVEAPVREAALAALHLITGRDLRFDPQAGEADRAKKIKAWRDWWKKTEEENKPSPGSAPPPGKGEKPPSGATPVGG